jgi:hypothetical protein
MAKQSEIRKQHAEQAKRITELEGQLADTLAQLAATGGATPAEAKKAAKAPASRLAQSQVEDVPGAGDPK